MNEERIGRINELARASRERELTEEEKLEQKKLREEYIQAIRESMRANLNNISIVEKDGSITDLGKKYGNVKEV